MSGSSMLRFWGWGLTSLMLIGVLTTTRQVQAKYYFCAKASPQYVDQGEGDDYLNVPNGSYLAAQFFYVRVMLNNVSQGTFGLDSQGCTTTGFTSAGTYSLIVDHKLTFGALNPTTVTIHANNVNVTHSSQFTWSNLPASPGTTADRRYGILGTSADTAGRIRVGMALTRLGNPGSGYDYGLKSGKNYRILAQATNDVNRCISCFEEESDLVRLGTDSATGVQDNNSKYIIGHEFGHYQAHELYGSWNANYCAAVTDVDCTCEQVEVSAADGYYDCNNNGRQDEGEQINRLHCLNSRELDEDSMQEGYAHLFATALFNSPTQSDAKFVYYKDYRTYTGGEESAPYPHNVVPTTPFRWMETLCPDSMSGRGTELDWLAFMWRIRSQTTNKYSFVDVARVYRIACAGNQTCSSSSPCTLAGGGGSCVSSACEDSCADGEGGRANWSVLTGAIARSGFSVSKRDHWVLNGDTYGVEH